ncbi:LuxR family transcriptional regulator [Streptomyces tanashiensis]|uniref:helix-turn-helix transcriptional regulator n=1 Tax=Streptomyces tanashiensis TaxID=67367 RepID=UPI0019A3F4AC|nr:helix-turn-helix transcriptional regulator [Streptomyces tanashiensis]GGS99358.1 LuxR family transcriptional regulator [Streptomyces tanashiensis]
MTDVVGAGAVDRGPAGLSGRDHEREVLDGLLAGAWESRGGAVVLLGEAGSGKTALLDSCARAASGRARLLRCTGVQSEAELPYAGLQVLLRGTLNGVRSLPERQLLALRGAIAPDEAPAGDRFLVGVATLGLLDELAEERPAVVLVDDAHWLDLETMDALLFAARRLGMGRVAVVFAAHEDAAAFDGAPGLPVLHLGPLTDGEGAALLAGRAPDLHPAVSSRILGLAQGNPLALVELVAALTPAQRDGSEPLDAREIAVLPASWRVRRIFDERIRALPAPTRLLLTAAAADDTGDVALLVAAGERLGVAARDLGPAEAADLVRVSGRRLGFRHPLARAAAYQGAVLVERTAAHRALAEAASAAGDMGRRAWHLAAATVGYDEEVAAELERSAELFRSRGGRAAVAAAYRRSARLTEDQAARSLRLAAASAAAAEAGQAELAGTLADEAGPVSSPAAFARLASVRAALEHEQGRAESARLLLVEATSRVTADRPAMGAWLLFESAAMAWAAPDPVAAARDTRARAAPLDFGGHPVHRGASGVLDMLAGDPVGGVAAIREFAGYVVRTRHERSLTDQVRLHGWDMLLGEFRAVHDEAVVLERECRAEGAVGVLPRVLLRLARLRLFLGRHRDAYTTAVEGLEIACDTGQHHLAAMLSGVLAVLAALDGEEPDGTHGPGGGEGPRRTAVPGGDDGPDGGDRQAGGPSSAGRAGRDLCPHAAPVPIWLTRAQALLDLGLGRYDRALHRFTVLTGGPYRHLMVSVHSLPDQVEAAVRTDRAAGAGPAAERFARWAEATGTVWAAAVELRCRALLAADDAGAEELYERALAAHEGDGRPFEEARTRLLYGEWLRRAKRRAAAREALTAALESFERMPAAAWANRARTELRALGAAPAAPPPGADPVGRLTAQELRVVRLAATGLSNRDIGARLFLSPRTVGYHLSNAYPKLGVTSRAALGTLDLG